MGNSRIQFRRGKAAFWASENPILHSGEPGYETNTKKWKVGDGILPWNALPYMTGTIDSSEELADHIISNLPHPVYDDGPSLTLLYQNAKV
jgi:hypothetical protein